MTIEAIDFEFAEGRPLLASFWIPGIPAPGGSKRGFAIRKGGVFTGRVAMMDDAGQRNKDWRQAVVLFASEFMGTRAPFTCPLGVSFDFVMPRTKDHFRTTKKAGTVLRPDAPAWHTKKPDTTKLIRSTEDAFKGIVVADDSMIAMQFGTKTYGERPGCAVKIFQL